MQSTDALEQREVFVSFRIFAPGLDPEEITKNLRLVPDHMHRQGDHISRNPKHAYKHGMWSIGSPLSRAETLEAHLRALLSTLEPRQSYIRTLAERTTVDFYCTLYKDNGFELSPQILNGIANLGATFVITVYPDTSNVPMTDLISSGE